MIVIEAASPKPRAVGALRARELSRFLSSAAKAVGLAGNASLLLTGDERIRAMNLQFRGIDRATDVLSFPAPALFAASGHAGDLAISWETALRQAEDCRHPLETEIKVLILHGLLHLAGLDHERDSGEMARREQAMRKRLRLPAGLIERGRSSPRRSALSGAKAAKKKPAAIARPEPDSKPGSKVTRAKAARAGQTAGRASP